jgi:hypothetical protein
MIPSTSPSMLCLYRPYNFSLVFAGGFSAPVRILLTVLRAWLKTLSVSWNVISFISNLNRLSTIFTSHPREVGIHTN